LTLKSKIRLLLHTIIRKPPKQAVTPITAANAKKTQSQNGASYLPPAYDKYMPDHFHHVKEKYKGLNPPEAKHYDYLANTVFMSK
jgi:hypothetical protein